MRKTLLLLLAPLLLGAAPAAGPSTRPAHDRDPWIFRCVLDGNARMVVISLGNDVWVAYDANRCRLAKVWKGKVEFTGPVFDTKHGPQPKSDGVMLLDRPARLAPLMAQSAEQSANEELDGYRGYRIKGNAATLNFDFGDTKVEETPTAHVQGETATTVSFRREIKVSWDTSKGGTRKFEVPTSSAVRSIRLADGSDVKFDADKNGSIELREPGTIIIETTLSTE